MPVVFYIDTIVPDLDLLRKVILEEEFRDNLLYLRVLKMPAEWFASDSITECLIFKLPERVFTNLPRHYLWDDKEKCVKRVFKRKADN